MSDEQIAETKGPAAQTESAERAKASPVSDPRWKDTDAMGVGVLMAAAEAFNDPLSPANQTAFAIAALSHSTIIFGLNVGWTSSQPDAIGYGDPHPDEKEELRRGKLKRAHRNLVSADCVLYLGALAGLGGAILCAVLTAWIGAAVLASVPVPAYIAYRRLTKSAAANENSAHESDQKAIELANAQADLELKRLEIRRQLNAIETEERKAIAGSDEGSIDR